MTHTNLELQKSFRKAKEKLSQKRDSKCFHPTDETEILAFIGLSISLGLNGLQGVPVNEFFSTKKGVASLGSKKELV